MILCMECKQPVTECKGGYFCVNPECPCYVVAILKGEQVYREDNPVEFLLES